MGSVPARHNRGLNDGESRVGPWAGAPAKTWQARRMAVYAGMVQSLDRGVGKILDDLTKRGLDRNTLVIFLSDNGACQENVQPGWYDIPSTTRDGRPIAAEQIRRHARPPNRLPELRPGVGQRLEHAVPQIQAFHRGRRHLGPLHYLLARRPASLAGSSTTR